MVISAADAIPLSEARVRLSVLANVAAGKLKAARSNLSSIRRRRGARGAGCGRAMRREDVMAHHMLLYAGSRDEVVLLSTRHQRQLAFDSRALWPARP